MKDKLEYSIKEKNENVYDNIIEVKGAVGRFTPREVIIEYNRAKKIKSEIDSNMSLRIAEMLNIVGTNPEVLNIDEKKMLAIYLYYEKFAFIREAEKKLKNVEAMLERTENDIKEIEKQTKLKIKIV